LVASPILTKQFCLKHAITDLENPYRYLSVQVEVIERGGENDREHLDSLAERYMGCSEYSGPSGQDRVVLVIRADKVSGRSPPSRNWEVIGQSGAGHKTPNWCAQE